MKSLATVCCSQSLTELVTQSDIQTVRQSDGQTDSQTDRQSDGQTVRQSDSQTVIRSDSQTDGQTDSLSVCLFACYSCLSNLGIKCLNFDFFFRVILTQVAGYVNK